MNDSREIITPKPLEEGSRIAIISTARKITPNEAEPAFETIRSWGFEPVKGPNLFAEHHQYAGDDHARAGDLQWALNDPNIDAILCARGGYGTIRLLEMVDFSVIRENPKWIAGYSDVTALHNHLIRNFNVAACHSTMAVNMGSNTPEALESLKAVLTGESRNYKMETHPFNRMGEASGPLLGGNLSMIYSLNSTPYFPDLEGAILFLEDLDELLYHVDRMMMNLRASGVFDKIAGLAIGGMTDMRDNKVPFGQNADEIIADAIAGYDFPVAFNVPAGHIENNCALRMGINTKLAVPEGTASLTN